MGLLYYTDDKRDVLLDLYGKQKLYRNVDTYQNNHNLYTSKLLQYHDDYKIKLFSLNSFYYQQWLLVICWI